MRFFSFQFIAVLYVFAIVVNVVLAVVVYRKNRASATNKIFGLLSVVIIAWLVVLLSEQILIFINKGTDFIWLARGSIFLAVPEVVLIFLLVLTIPRTYISLRPILWIALLLPSVGMMIINLTPLVFAYERLINGVPYTTPGRLAPLFGVFMCAVVVASLIILFCRFRQQTGVARTQLKLLFIGFILMLGLLTFTLLLPTIVLGRPLGLPLVPVAVLLFLFFTAIAILKYKLFNLRLLATQGFALLLGFILFVQLFIFDFRGAIFSRLMNFSVPQNLELLFGLLALLLCIYLGFTVIIKNHKSATSWLFFILTLILDSYLIINYLSLHPPGGAATQLFWIRLVMFVCSFIGPALFLLACNFPADRFLIRAKYYAPVLILTLVSAGVSLLPLVFTDLQFPGGRPLPTPGPGMPLFLLDFVGLFVASFILLVYKYKKSADEAKRPLGFFTAGVILTFSLMALTTVISVVFFKSSALVFAGPISSVLLVAFVAYAIIKRHIFNIKILAVEFFVALIAVILIVEGAASGAVGQSVFKLFFAILVCFLGFFLVRGVRREIEQEREITRLSALAESNRRLQELDKQKTEFLNIAAHQLRTPVSIIKNYVAMLQEGDYGQVSEPVREVHKNIEESNEWLVRLADEFLNIANLEQGRTRFKFEEVNVVHLVDSVVKELAIKAKKKGLKIVWDNKIGGLIIKADPEKLRNVIFNLVDNAVKYSDRGLPAMTASGFACRAGEITVDMEEKDSGAAVRVIDQGIGFNKNDEKVLFQKFQRGELAKKHEANTSTGLGLYIVRMFVEGHGGQVWAKSAGEGKGSEFGFWIPEKRG